jgi:hypothetical protein
MLSAEWSLETPVKYQHNVLLAFIVREPNLTAGGIAGGKIRSDFVLLFISHKFIPSIIPLY